MDSSIRLPKLIYENVENRGYYKYADDLFSTDNWNVSISNYDDQINKYLHQRNEFGIVENSLREIEFKSKYMRETIDSFQTLSGKILNNFFFESVGKSIEKYYEHYQPANPSPPLEKNEMNIYKIPESISRYIVDLYSIEEMLNRNIDVIVKPESIEYHKKFMNGEEKGNYVSNNPRLHKYGLQPEIIGMDIANLTSGGSEETSVAFVAGGLFDWDFVTPQKRSFGSSGNLGAIIIDILFNNINLTKPSSYKEYVETTDSSLYIFEQIKYYYKDLVEKDIIDELIKINTNYVDNPSILGIVDNTYRVPDIYALWCIYRSVRTPFYNRKDRPDKKPIDMDIQNIFNYEFMQNSNTIIFKNRPSSISKDKVNQFKEKIIKEFEDNLSTVMSELITDNVPSDTIANEGMEKTIKKLKSLKNDDWYNIISQGFTSLYLSLFIASETNWGYIRDNYHIYIPFQQVSFKKDNTTASIFSSNDDRKRLIKIGQDEYFKYQDTLRSLLGNNKENTMGGMSLIKTSLTIQRFGNTITYPNDVIVLERISNYLKMFFSDMAIVENRLRQALHNMSNMYWYRDILRWLEILFQTLRPHDVPAGDSGDPKTLQLNFYKLEKIIKNMYSKKLQIITSFNQMSSMLQSRYNKKLDVNKLLEKEIKLSSYYTRSMLCYITRQINIVYYLLDKTLESIWTTAPDGKQPRLPSFFKEDEFKRMYRDMKVGLSEWFREEISRYILTVKNPEMISEIRTLVNDSCNITSSKSVPSKTIKDEQIKILTNSNFWLVFIANLKNKNSKNLEKEKNNLNRLYIPIYDNSTDYLFDIMPLVLSGKYKGVFGGKSSPEWLTADDLEKEKFSKENQGIVLIANTAQDVASIDWNAISVEWFDKLLSKSEDASEDSDKKMWLIRNAISMIINNNDIYNSKSLKIKKIGEKMKKVLEKYQNYSDSDKSKNNKYLSLVSREYLKNEMNTSIVHFL